MNKQAALAKYDAATRLGYQSTRADWLAVFPDRYALAMFRAEVGNLTWPENFGSSPWEYAFGVAYKASEGFTPSSREFYDKQIAAGCRYCRAEVEAVKIYAPNSYQRAADRYDAAMDAGDYAAAGAAEQRMSQIANPLWGRA